MLDELDLQILKEFAKLKDNEYSSTWKIMKKIYPNGRERENQLIKFRIKRMSKDGLFSIEGLKTKVYTLISDKVEYRKFSFPNGRKNAIAINYDKWEVFEI